MRLAAFNTGPDIHLLDHIGPFSKKLNIPLFIEEERNFSLCQRYYPAVNAVLFPEIEQNLRYFAENFDALVECKYWKPELKRIFLDFFQKEMLLFFCAHGQSDKTYNLAPYATQDLCFVYGDLLQDMLQELSIQSKCKTTGNYRLSFYQEHKTFYDSLAEKEIFSRLPKNNKNLLYAPTWKDLNSATSFFTHAKELFSLPLEGWNWIVKVHPLLEQRNPEQYYQIISLLDRCPNAVLVDEFPPIYPLLAKSDAYLGDYSSVGYDFLYFQKPMFFLLEPHILPGKIHACGTLLSTPQDLLNQINTPNIASLNQQQLYRHAFSTKLN